MKKVFSIVFLISAINFVYCQIPNRQSLSKLMDATLPPSGEMKRLSQTDFGLLISTNFISDFNSANNNIKHTKKLAYPISDLKGITTRQIPNASRLFKRCAPGVVLLISLDATSMGSGSIVSTKGEIITNWHVVEGVDKMLVWFYDPRITSLDQLDPENYAVAEVVATDPTRDLAMLKLMGIRKDASPLELGNNYQLSVAQDVFAIGHPEAYIWTFTYGVISQLRNNHNWSYDEYTNFTANMIQTQTPTNPGNSGGPLFNDKGKLVGINSYGTEGQGLNFAIRIGEVQKFIQESREGKHKPQLLAEETIEQEPEWEPVDMNENGVIDSYRLSSKNDEIFDIAKVDENEDGEIDYFVFDTNRDGQIDTIVFDKDDNGTFEYFIIDDNYDGKYDTTGVDTDGDAIPDAFFAYSE